MYAIVHVNHFLRAVCTCLFGRRSGDCTAYMQSEVAQLPLSHKLWAWFEANRKQTVWGAGIVVALGLIIAFVVWKQGANEVTASEALSNVSAPQTGAPGARPEAAGAFLKVASEYPKSSAGARALLLAAGSLFVEGKFPEAKAQFERFTREHHDSPFMGQALLGIAACDDAEGKTNEAVTAYKNLVDHHSGESVIPQAKFALARLYEGQGKFEQARSLYEELNRNEPYGSLGSEAGIRLEELLEQHPELVPKPVAQPMLSNAPSLTLPKR
jgi:predicted negative regulator of RcsB-dependent stress response